MEFFEKFYILNYIYLYRITHIFIYYIYYIIYIKLNELLNNYIIYLTHLKKKCIIELWYCSFLRYFFLVLNLVLLYVSPFS